MARESLTAFWATQHVEDNTRLLTGTTFDEMRELFDLHLVEPMPTVLEIGVGLGHVVRGLHAAGCRVHALDICPQALARVADVTEAGYLVGDPLPTSTFDLVLCHLVAQHMTDAAFRAQFPAVFRSLAPADGRHGRYVRGRCIIQFAGAHETRHNNRQTQAALRKGGVCRSPAHARRLIRQCGGTVRHVRQGATFPAWNTYWYFVECEEARS